MFAFMMPGLFELLLIAAMLFGCLGVLVAAVLIVLWIIRRCGK